MHRLRHGHKHAGLIAAVENRIPILGFSVLKNAYFLNHDIESQIKEYSDKKIDNWSLNLDYHFGGFAKTSARLFGFIRLFKQDYAIQLGNL
jgi:1-aminocyclopropane-1-carboxylate deaminase